MTGEKAIDVEKPELLMLVEHISGVERAASQRLSRIGQLQLHVLQCTMYGASACNRLIRPEAVSCKDYLVFSKALLLPQQGTQVLNPAHHLQQLT